MWQVETCTNMIHVKESEINWKHTVQSTVIMTTKVQRLQPLVHSVLQCFIINALVSPQVRTAEFVWQNCPPTVCDAFNERNVCVWCDVMEDQQFRHFCCGTNSTNVTFQTPGVSIYWLDFTLVSLGKKFTRMKPFSFQTYCSIINGPKKHSN